jgi:Rieske Fe-S protein
MIGETRTHRRLVFQGLGALGVAVALAGCGGGSGDDGDDGSEPAVDAGAELAGTSEVPVGGGVVLTDEKIVLTQPSAGEFKAFSAVCTHQQLLVTGVEAGVIECDNHGSTYDAATGEVAGGPAPAALREVAITVDGDRILAA